MNKVYELKHLTKKHCVKIDEKANSTPTKVGGMEGMNDGPTKLDNL